MKLKQGFFLAILGLLVQNGFSQNKEAFFKVFPVLEGGEPEWVVQMYEVDANVFEVVDLYHSFYRSNVFEKNIHTQNFKYWLRTTEDYVQPSGQIVVPAKEEQLEILNEFHDQRYLGAPEAKTTTWINIGPDRTYKNDGSLNLRPTQVNIFSMGVAPSFPDIMYGAAEGGGIFKTSDHGLNWELTSVNEVFTNAQDIKVHPTNPSIVYVAASDDIYKTEDGGVTWSLNYSAPGTVEQFYIHRTDPSKVYAATANGLFLTEDDGGSWDLLFDERCWDIEAHVIDPDILFLSIHNAGAKKAQIYKSIDAGDSWELKDTDWYTPTDYASASDIGCKIGVTPADPDRIYACLIGNSKSGDNGWIGVYYSIDGADNWVNADGIDGGPYEPGNDMATNWYVAGYADGYHQGWYNFDMDVSHTDPDKIWIGTIWMCESGNRGANIEYIRGTRSLEMHADIQDIDVVGGEVWVASDGGLNFSTDECATVEVRNTGVSSSTYWGFNQGWNEDTWAGGRYHNGDAVYHENFGFGNTMFMGGAETSTGYVNPLNNRETHYSDIADKITPDALSESSSNAQNYSIYPNESYALLNSSEVEYDSRYADHLYLGNENIFYKSTDGGASFTDLFTFPEFSRVLEFEISRVNPAVIYCLVRDGFAVDLYKSTDGGGDFVLTTEVPTDNASRLDLSINPEDENELWIASHFGGDGAKVFATYDGGDSWVNKTTAVLDGRRIKDIVFQGGSDEVVYAATNYGFFYWDKPTSEWLSYSEDLPFVVRALHLRPFYRDNKLRLGGGRGVWEVGFAKESLPVAQPITKSDVVYCSRDTVQFECYSILAHDGASWEWSFSPAPAYVSGLDERNPKVVFSDEGSYDVTLTVIDGDGNSDSKTIENMVTLDNQCSPDPNSGFAMECYESGDYASTPNLGIGETNNFSVSAWVKPDGVQPDYTGIVFNDGVSAGLNFRPGNLLAYHWPGGQWWWDSGLIVEEGVWSHVALVVTPDSVTVYLNGIGSTHIITLEPALIETMKMGSYKGWGSRNFAGVMDEVCIWNRSLTQNEVREARHLTRTGDIPYIEDLVSYYQFNIEGITAVNDRVGTSHAVLNAGASKIVSTAPVGEGNSDRILVSGGEVYCPNSEMRVVFADGTDLNGEVVFTRIHLEPDSLPSDNPNTRNYWIVNNYGEASFTAIETIEFKVHDASPEGLPENAALFIRGENEELNVWEEICVASDFDGGTFNYNETCAITNFSQFYIESNISGDLIITGVPEDKSIGVKVYPNPSNGLFYIDFVGYETLDIEILDNLGRSVYKNQLVSGKAQVDLTNFAKGMYLYQLKSGETVVHSGQIVKQ